MNQWAAIKPKSSNQNKLSGVRPIQTGKTSLSHYRPTTSDKSMEEEVARAVQQLLELNKTNQSDASDNASNFNNEKVLKTPSPTPGTSNQSNQDIFSYKTPENDVAVQHNVDNVIRSKKNKKSNQFKRPTKTNNPDISFLTNSDHVEGDDRPQAPSPKRLRFDQDLIDETGKSVSGEQYATTNNIAKYLKVEGDEGYILSAYYTPGQDEKLKDFVPVYVNIGNPLQAKELIGIRKNTKFLSTNAKSRMKSTEEQPNYLVLSFENRKKNNSPFIEYPLNRLDMLIQGLQELKERVIQSGHYKEQTILNCKYPQNTKICPGDDKATILKLTS